jgi:hypothetical protein
MGYGSKKPKQPVAEKKPSEVDKDQELARKMQEEEGTLHDRKFICR